MTGALVEFGLPLLAVATLIALNALFVFHEFAYVSITPTQLRRIEKSPTTVSALVVKGVRNLDHYIAVDQLGITATSIAVGWIGQPVISDLLSRPLAYVGITGGGVTVVVTVLAFALIIATQMVLGELVPKTVSLRYAERIAHLVAIPIEITARILHPAVVVLNGLGSVTVRMLGYGSEPGGHSRDLSSDELIAIAERSARAGMVNVNPRAVRMVLSLSEVSAKDIMVPRHAVIGIEQGATVQDVLRIGRAHKHARYPVYEGSIDRIIGVLNVKELVQMSEIGEPRIVTDWKPFVRKIAVLPSASTIEQVLQELRRSRQEMAILVDEYGGTDGIVTVTSVARFTLGHSRNLRRIARGRFLVAGHVGLAVLDAALDVTFHDEESGVETVGGFIMERLDRVPEPNDQITIDGVVLSVVSMDGRRVEQVLVQLPETADSGDPNRPVDRDF